MYKHTTNTTRIEDNMILDKYDVATYTTEYCTLYLLEINKYSSSYCKQCKEVVVLFLIREMSI